jgi:iron complex outermembrane recepter protein
MSLQRTLIGSLLATSSVAFAASAQAQVAPVGEPVTPGGAKASEAPLEDENSTSADIVVTARGRDEVLQKLPDAVTVISGATIDQAGVRNVADLTRLVPNFNFRSGFRAGAAQITVRGLTTPQGGDLPIAFVVDGVQLNGADFLNQDLLDIAQVQVLRGPQGALYGQGALAGAMLITTRAPTNDFEFNGRASYGTANTYRAVGSVSGPIIEDKLYFRALASYRNSDGTIKDVGGNGRNFVDESYFRGELRYDGGGFRANLSGNYNKGHNGSIYQDRVPALAIGVYDIDRDQVNIVSNIVGNERREIYGGSLRLEQDLAGGVLSSTTSYNRVKSTAFGDADFGAANTLSQTNIYNVSLWNEDFRYTSSSDKPFRYVFGAFAQSRIVDQALTVPFLSGAGFAARSADRQKGESWALFAQINYNITEKLELTGALRYDANHRNRLNILTNVFLEEDFKKLQPKVSAAYNWSDNFMTYATFAIGYRSGGFNAASSVFAGPLIAGETSNNYEVGFKARTSDGRASIAASAFHIDLKNGQFFFISLTPPSQNTVNINKSHINGAEVEVSLRPVRRFNLTGSLGISDAQVDDFNGTGLNDNTPFPNVPSYTARGSASYDIPLGGDYTLTPRVDMSHRGRMYFLPGNSFRSNPYTDTDLRLTLATPVYSLSAYVANVSDERHAEQVNNTGLRTVSVPRTYGIELSFKLK